MGLEMRALGVHLLASGELAFVYPAFRVGRTVLVASRVVPVGHGGRGRGCTRVRVLRAGYRGEAVRRDGDQSAKKRKMRFPRSHWPYFVVIKRRSRRDIRKTWTPRACHGSGRSLTRAKQRSSVIGGTLSNRRTSRASEETRANREERNSGDGLMMDRESELF